MASIATISVNPTDGSAVLTPITKAEIDTFFTTELAPRIAAQVSPLITSAEQRAWQKMVEADSNLGTVLTKQLLTGLIASLQAQLASM
jgi:hypothetical protein